MEGCCACADEARRTPASATAAGKRALIITGITPSSGKSYSEVARAAGALNRSLDPWRTRSALSAIESRRGAAVDCRQVGDPPWMRSPCADERQAIEADRLTYTRRVRWT